MKLTFQDLRREEHVKYLSWTIATKIYSWSWWNSLKNLKSRQQSAPSLVKTNKMSKLELLETWKPPYSLNLEVDSQKEVHLVFLMETKCTKNRVYMVRGVTNFDNCFVVDSYGKSGGLAMLWKNKIKAQVQSFTKWYISLLVKVTTIDKDWLLTGFYGHLDTSKRYSTLNLLKALNQNLRLP